MNEIKQKVSVVMSVYGYQQYISDSIKSILDQTLEDFEFIIIDDGCDYDLLNIIKKFNDKRITYIKNSKNLGLTCSLIKGVEKSRGKYIARQDAGNISIENRLEKQYGFLERNSQYYLIGSSVELIDENGGTICKIIANDNPRYIKRKLPLYNCINHSTIVFRNNNEAGYRDKFKYSQDYDFYLNLLSKNFILGNISEVLLKEIMTPASITYLERRKQQYFKEMAQKFYYERIKSGRDSYNLMMKADLPGNSSVRKEHKKNGKKNSFYQKQKVYYLLFSGRTRKARKQILNYLETEFNIKIIMYLVASFFPFIIKLINKLRGLEYK